jgi:hypothetical protein
MMDSYCADFQLAGTGGNFGERLSLDERVDPAPIYDFLCGILGGERGWQFNVMPSHYILVLFHSASHIPDNSIPYLYKYPISCKSHIFLGWIKKSRIFTFREKMTVVFSYRVASVSWERHVE